MPDSHRRRAVFLDRDGTVAEEYGYANHISRFQIFPFAPAAIRRLNDAGVPVVVLTNQSGVARGFFPEKLVHEMHEKLKAELEKAGAHLEGIYFCPHQKSDGCRCRKPLPGMLEQAAREHDLETRGSIIISDRHADIEMGHQNGCRTILVLTGYGRGEYEWNRRRWACMPDHVAENLAEAVEIVLKEMR